MKFLGEGPTRLLPPPSSSSSSPPPRGFDLESTELLWLDPDDGSTQGGDPVEGVREAMLRHHHVFRAQLFELHRLYWTQKSLMSGFPYDHQSGHHNAAPFHWAAAEHMPPMQSVAGKAKAEAATTAEERSSSISSQQKTPLNFVPGWNVDDRPLRTPYSHGSSSKLPQQEWLSASDFRLFHDCHSARDPQTRYFQQPQPSDRSAACWAAVAVKPEPVDLTLGAANGSSNHHNMDQRTSFWGRFPFGKPQASLTGPNEVINLDSSPSSSDSDEVNREVGEEAARRPPASCLRVPPSQASRQECRLPRPFDMNRMCDEGADHYGTGHSMNMQQPEPNGADNHKSEKTVLIDLNTVQDEDSSAVIQEAENNVLSSSAGSSVVVHGVANDGRASAADFGLGFGNTCPGERSMKIEINALNSDLKSLESKRARIQSTNEIDNAQSSWVEGSSSLWNCGRRDINPVVLHTPRSKCLLELNSLPDDTVSDDMEEMVVLSSNGSLSVSQPKLHCSGSKYPSNLVDLASDSRVTSSVTDCLAGGCHQLSLGSTNLPSAVGQGTGSAAKRIEGERSEEDTVSSRMHGICSLFQDGRANPSLEQKQGEQLEACAFRNEPQGDNLSNLFRSDDDALISDIDGRASQQQLNSGGNNASGYSVAGAGESGSQIDNPRNCYSGLQRRDGADKILSKHHDMDKDLMILTAAETLAHIFNTGGASCTPGFPDAVPPKEVGEEMECDARPECSYDSLELIVLALPESQEDECSSPANTNDNLSMGAATTTENGPGLRFNTRRGRQLRDFQKDILPGIVSLSRHEICEDMHAFTEIVKFEEMKRKGGRPGRWATNRGGSRGSVVRKKRSRTGAYVQRR